MSKITFVMIFMLTVSYGFGQNLIVNGDFETGELAPFVSPSGGVTVQQAEPFEGTYHLNIGNDFRNVFQNFTAEANTDYTVSLMYKMNFEGVGADDAAFVSIRIDNGTNPGEPIEDLNFRLDPSVTEYTEFTFDFNTDNTDLKFFIFSPNRSTSGPEVNNALRVDNISITEKTLSTNRLESVNFELYPNPASEAITLSATESIDKVEIFNLSGKLVKSHSVNKPSERLYVNDLTSGVYIVRTQIGESLGTKKLIIK